MTVGTTNATLTFAEVNRLALQYDVPVEDVLLIALNLCGILADQPRRRARVTVRLATAPEVAWMIIVPLNAAASPFRLFGENLLLGTRKVAKIQRVDADEAVGGYFRNDGRAATLNPNARSRCVGCAFCPNTLEAAADPRFSDERKLGELLEAMREQHPRHDLTELREITISTGCFEREAAAVTHLVGLRKVLDSLEIEARIGFLTSVIVTDAAFAQLATQVSPLVLRLTVECFTRRNLMLKASKARLQPSSMPDLMRRARAAGLDTSFTYVVGLDPLVDLRAGVAGLVPHVSDFPNFQVYQAHNAIMAGLRSPTADAVEFYLQARLDIEQIMGPTGLRPQVWEGYRSLWYFAFADEELARQ